MIEWNQAASRASARVEGCPSYTSPGIDSPVRTDSNYGCATNSNLAAMVANPEDLVHGREGGGFSTVAGTKAVQLYRSTPPSGSKGLQAISTQKKDSQ